MRGRSRRRFLQVSLAGLTAGLAGCGMPGGEGEEEGGEDDGEDGDGTGDDEGGSEGENGGESGEDDDRSASGLGPDA